jgi:hypothetical protein
MIVKYPCPACQKNLYFPEQHGLAAAKQEIVCQNCDRKYQIQYWQVVEGKTRREILPNKKFLQAKTIEIDCYQLKVISSEQRQTENLDFSIPEREHFKVFTSSSILTIVSQNNPKILGIINLETGQKYQFYSLKISAIRYGSICGAIAFVACSTVGIVGHIPSQILQYLVLFLPAIVAITSGHSHWQKNKERDSIKLTRLRQEQALLAQMEQLNERLEKLEDDRHQETRLLDRLTAIKQEMIGVSRDIYAAQIQTYSRGITILDRQAELTKDLIERYQKVVAMLRIAYNTSQIEANLPDLDLNNSNISTKLNELEMLERKREELVAEVELTKILR